MAMNLIAQNKKARHDYEIIQTFETGIVLAGSEVKALRAKRANLKDSYCRFIKDELFLVNAHITHLETTYMHFTSDTKMPRKLLLHRKELNKMFLQSTRDGLTIVPLMIYFNERNKVKLSIALAKGKKLFDKRADSKGKTLDREAAQAIKDSSR
jgi:SsrA-binding protein